MGRGGGCLVLGATRPRRRGCGVQTNGWIPDIQLRWHRSWRYSRVRFDDRGPSDPRGCRMAGCGALLEPELNWRLPGRTFRAHPDDL
jgi:hypothetical protein